MVSNDFVEQINVNKLEANNNTNKRGGEEKIFLA